MKPIAYLILILLATSCSPSDREAKDLTDEKEQNISPNQTQSEAEQAKKDSTSFDVTKTDTASHSGK